MITRNLEKAREAFEHKDIKETIKIHSSKSLEPPEPHMTSGTYIKSAIYGGLDGIITTFAVVAGAAGASLSSGVVLILGFANLIGDGISMAVGDYLSTKSEQEYHKKERKREEWEVENYPEGEHKEMVELYMDKGYTKEESEKVVAIMEKNKKAFVDLMMVEELGILQDEESPIKNALVTFGSFILFGFIPLLAFVLAIFFGIVLNMLLVAIILTALTLFALGALKTYVTGKNWFLSGLEMLVVGGIASGAAYLIGYALQGLV
jgi:VIT1/CCC1 family predicted Fe2+/Mn2+ transporter